MTLKEMEAAMLAMAAKLAAAEKAVEDAKKANQRTLSFKVSEKGAVSVYGFGRFPVTLYATNMLRFLSVAPAIVAFIEEHKASLVWTKGKLAGEDAPAVVKLA